jgi:hypothetical protein
MSWWYWWQIHLMIGKATDVSPISMHGFSTYIKPSTAETRNSGLDVACDSSVTGGVKGNIICLSDGVPSAGAGTVGVEAENLFSSFIARAGHELRCCVALLLRGTRRFIAATLVACAFEILTRG